MPKRIIICCDGTWNTPEKKDVTNVTKFARAIKQSDSGTPQVVFYDWGIGTDGGADKIKGGAFGAGIDKNIQDAYRFLVHNFAIGDEVYLFGFSRGAYTVRSLVGLIRNCWLLRKFNAELIPDAYKVYRSISGVDDKKAKAFRLKYARKIRIKFMGVWDTVGALGIPIGLFGKYNEKKYGFHDTTITSIVDNAYHSLAINEKRKPFKPTLWKTKPKRANTEQVWFVGVHADVGGGYKEAHLSDIALNWMVKKATQCDLSFNDYYLKKIKDNNKVILHSESLLGTHIRDIGVTNFDESLHISVKALYQKNKKYRPKNLIKYLSKKPFK